MRRARRLLILTAASALLPFAQQAGAQRYSGMSSPPTAPSQGQFREQRLPAALSAANQPIQPVSSGMGAIQFYAVNYGAPAPQSLTRQLLSDEEKIRQSALVAIGAPGQYTAKGQVPYPHSVQLELAALGTSPDLDALLTVELEHHLVTAVLIPDNGNWRRVATVVFPTAFADPSTTPATFLRTNRSLLEPDRYRAVFRGRENQANGDYVESEAHLRILNNRAIITSSFADETKTCTQAGSKGQSCDFTHRWLQPDLSQPGVKRFQMITATGMLAAKDLANPLASARDFQLAHVKTYTCQPFTFSDASLHYEPTGPNGPCRKPGAR